MSDPVQELDEGDVQGLERILEKVAGSGEIPAPLLRFVLEITPTPNVDLVVLDSRLRVLLAWRDDPFGRGWHVPGSLIRHRETVETRLQATAEKEIGCALDIEATPFAILQTFDDRGHSISLCHRAKMKAAVETKGIDGFPSPGDLRWFDELPSQMYPPHDVYREVLARTRTGTLEEHAAVFTRHVGSRNPRPDEQGVISADRSIREI